MNVLWKNRITSLATPFPTIDYGNQIIFNIPHGCPIFATWVMWLPVIFTISPPNTEAKISLSRLSRVSAPCNWPSNKRWALSSKLFTSNGPANGKGFSTLQEKRKKKKPHGRFITMRDIDWSIDRCFVGIWLIRAILIPFLEVVSEPIFSPSSTPPV